MNGFLVIVGDEWWIIFTDPDYELYDMVIPMDEISGSWIQSRAKAEAETDKGEHHAR